MARPRSSCWPMWLVLLRAKVVVLCQGRCPNVVRDDAVVEIMLDAFLAQRGSGKGEDAAVCRGRASEPLR